MSSNRWISLAKTQKKQDNTFEAAIHRIQNINILEKLCNLQNRYDLNISPNVIFKHNRQAMQDFAKAFYKAFIFLAIPKFKTKKPFQTQVLSLQLKTKYAQIFNYTQTKKRSSILQFYSFLICLVSKGVMDYAAGQNIQTSHLFKKREQSSQRIQTAEIAFIFLTYETLGLKIGSSAFTVLFKRYIRKQTIKQSLFDIGKICISNEFILSLSKPKQKTITEHDIFRSELCHNLKALKPQNQQKKRKIQHLKTQSFGRESQYDLKNYLEIQNTDLKQVIRGNQVSTSFNYHNKSLFRDHSKSPKINMNPINFQELNRMSKRRARHMTQFRLKDISTAESPKHHNKLQLRYWKQKVRKMKEQSNIRVSCEDFTISLKKKQNNQNIFQSFPDNKDTLNTSQKALKFKKSQVQSFVDQQQFIERCQMGLVTKMQNYPCQGRKSVKNKVGNTPSQLKNLLKQFASTCRDMEKVYKQNTVNQILSQQIPYLGKNKKRRKKASM